MNNIFVISLTNTNQLCLIDILDRESVIKYKWFINDNGYVRCTKEPYEGFERPYLHQFIFGERCDHINRLRWDCRRDNLRKASLAQNNRNTSKVSGCSSSYRGVYWNWQHEKWLASITKNKKRYYLGLFKNEQDAAMSYDAKALQLFGEFANLNFPKSISQN